MWRKAGWVLLAVVLGGALAAECLIAVLFGAGN
jgi:hypothetical protein